MGMCSSSVTFFRWYDVEKPHRWQHLVIFEARDIIREKKEEITNLRENVRPLTHDSENLEISSEVIERMKGKKMKKLKL